MDSKSKTSLKLLVDKKSNKVLFAKAGKDFIDLLFSLMEIPFGSIMGLLVQEGMAGCGSLTKIYDIFQNHHPSFLQSNQVEDSLLRPKAASSSSSYDSSEEVAYMVMDDLTVKPFATISVTALRSNFDVKLVSDLREKTVDVGIKKALELLKTSFESNTVLTDVFLGNWLMINWREESSCLTMLSKVTLMSSDGEPFEVDEVVALQSQTIKHVIEDDCTGSFIPLPNVTSNILGKIIEYCKKHVDGCSTDDEKHLKAWDAEFVKVDQATLFDLILAANYLEIKSLLDLTCQTIADMIKGKTPEELRKTFNIKTSFTPEEEEEVRRENQWAFE